MSAKLSVSPEGGFKIKELSVFDFPRLCKVSKKWYDHRRYKFFEKENLDKDQDRGRIVDIEHYGERKVDDYTRFLVRVGIHAKHLNKVKAENKVLESGFVDITVEGWIELDYKNTWEKGRFTKALGKFYNNYILKHKIDNVYFPKLYEELEEVKDILKEELHLYK